MKREEIADLMAFVVVAEERSFTRAAARLSMAQSALSQIVRRIEERLGLRLLTRTTRSVVPTEAGEHLLSVLSERFDAGVRLGGEMDKDMIAIRIGPDIPMAIVGSPDYFSRRSAPTSVSQLIDHQAINLYLPTSGTANRWRLIRGGREVRVRMEGQLLLNTIDLIIDAAIDGHGLAYLPYDQVERAIKEKKLIRVLDKFTPDLPGYHLYYPHRRHAGSAFSLFIDRLKYKGAV